ncbi:hypothetical protein R3X27_14315 [Tropicimonas sp. TH_r6]|uniref:hypothetical protein n=1 Tax=Tropicimonas sp. TH_r6 TaxID=3082085 RepID=UPI002953F7B9|nr:hypothetical protein [Tropicimonas sp. TH_r6]MDV7143857.1 hypothetical protein [Tropicimonas sp. TH_r6]
MDRFLAMRLISTVLSRHADQIAGCKNAQKDQDGFLVRSFLDLLHQRSDRRLEVEIISGRVRGIDLPG